MRKLDEIRNSKYLLPSIFLLLSVYYTYPFLTKYNYLGIRDWDLFTTIAAIPVGSIIDYGQFPFWNMYLGGGNILFHHPETLVLSPFLIIYLFFGAVVGLKIQVFICYFLGFWGSYKLFEKIGISAMGSLLGVVVYFGSVHFALHFAEGHMPFTHFCFLPWFLYFIFGSIENPKKIIWAAVSLALMILGNGAAIPLLYSLSFSCLLFVLLTITRNQFIYLKKFLLSVIIGVGLSAVKFIPMVIYMVQNKWEGKADEVISVLSLPKIFFGLDQSLFSHNISGQYWGWHEYGAYISPLVIILAVIALVKKFKLHYLWLVLLAFFLILGLGNFGSFSLWGLLSNLPGFSSARCTGRSFQMVILSCAVLGGFGFDIAWSYLKEKNIKYFKIILKFVLGVILFTNLFLVYPIMNSAFGEKLPQIYRNSEFHQVVDAKPQAYKNYLANRGSLVAPWLSAYHPSRGLVGPGGNVADEYILEGQAEIIKREYTPNRIEYVINGFTDGQIVFGMGFDPGWEAQNGIEVAEMRGLISVPFNKGENKIILVYRTPYFYTGIIVSILTVLFICFYHKRV